MNGAQLIAAERRRQMTEECWTAEHDDGHVNRQLVDGAICYAYGESSMVNRTVCPVSWPWEAEWLKFDVEDPVRNLVKAGAMLAAEIDRLLRSKGEEVPEKPTWAVFIAEVGCPLMIRFIEAESKDEAIIGIMENYLFGCDLSQANFDAIESYSEMLWAVEVHRENNVDRLSEEALKRLGEADRQEKEACKRREDEQELLRLAKKLGKKVVDA